MSFTIQHNMSVLVSLTIRLSAAIGILQLLGLYRVVQDVLIQNDYEQRFCPACEGRTEALYKVPRREGDNSFPLPPRHGGGIIIAVYNEPFYCVKMADNVLREFQDEGYSSTVAANMVNYHYHGYCFTYHYLAQVVSLRKYEFRHGNALNFCLTQFQPVSCWTKFYYKVRLRVSSSIGLH